MHYRDARPGRFYLADARFEQVPSHSDGTPAFLRFARREGVAVPMQAGDGESAVDLLHGARLAWPVLRRDVVIPVGPGISEPTTATHYRALVRPDTEQVMSVVTSHYAVAENEWVALATENFARRIEHRPSMLAAAGFGRDGERTLFAARIVDDSERTVCLLAYNTHGGEGAVRFQLVECDRETGTTYVLDNPYANLSFPHVGDLRDRLNRRSLPEKPHAETFVERYLAETQPLWKRLEDTLWTRRHTSALIRELWDETPDPTVGTPDGPRGVDDTKARHPGHHLPHRMDAISDAASAYRAICDWLDNDSEACERGDFTKDRDERLALGAGNRYKRDAWRWITTNVLPPLPTSARR